MDYVISRLRNFIIAILSMILIPITSKIYDAYMIYGFISFAIIIGIFALESIFLGKKDILRLVVEIRVIMKLLHNEFK